MMLIMVAAAFAQAQGPAAQGEQSLGAAERAIRDALSFSGTRPVEMRRRTDLDDLLHKLEAKERHRDIRFYELRTPPQTPFDGWQVKVVAVATVAASAAQSLDLFDFQPENRDGVTAEEFNRLSAGTHFSLTDEKAVQFASLFIESSTGGELSEIAKDEDYVHHSVERYYLTAYGGVSRALEAYVHWWEGFRELNVPMEPRVEFFAGRYHVTLNRVVMAEGRHPEVQEWSLAFSPNGEVRVDGVKMIYPKRPSWLFYDGP